MDRLRIAPVVEGGLEDFMFRTLRSRLFFGVAPLLAIMMALGMWAIVMFARLGGNIDVILREIVSAHGGQIEASSESGRGGTFTVRLPAAGNDRANHPEGATS